jgi:Ca2+-binding RTX toxin-like protein
MAFPPQGTAGNDVYYISGPFNTLHDGYAYLDGGAGFDAIVLSGGGAVLDYSWGGISNFEDLILASGSWSFTLGGAAAHAFTGMHVVIDASTAASVNIDGSGLSAGATLQVFGSAGADTIIGASGTNAFHGGGGADVLVGGASTDYFYFDTLAQLRQAHVDGAGGDNIIAIAADSAVTDAAFTEVQHADYLFLNGSGAQSVALGARALAASGGTMVIFASNATSLTYDGHAFTGTAWVHGTAGADNLHGGNGSNVFFGNGGADTLTGGQGNDFFHFGDRGQLASTTANGGGGTDTVVMDGGQRINDVDFLHISHMAWLDLEGGGAQIVTLGPTAAAAFGGSATVVAPNAHGLYLDASAFSGIVNVVATGFADSFVFGNAANDVIYNFATHGQANADQVQLLGHSLADVQAMLAGAVSASEGTYLYHDNHFLLFSGIAKAALSTADFLIA